MLGEMAADENLILVEQNQFLTSRYIERSDREGMQRTKRKGEKEKRRERKEIEDCANIRKERNQLFQHIFDATEESMNFS